jgi:hypothetical protein
MPTIEAVFLACSVVACDAAGVPQHCASVLTRHTPPRGEHIRQRQWVRARRVLAAELIHQGIASAQVIWQLDVTAGWIRKAYSKHADRFLPAPALPTRDN